MRILFSLVLVAVSFAPSLAATFELVDPQGFITGFAETSNTTIRFRELTGQHRVYLRQSKYDSADRSYVGYYSALLNRALRFPAGGYGPMYTADFDHANPRFRPARGFVRPAMPLGFGYQHGYAGIGHGSNVNSPYAYNHGYVPPYRFRRPQSVLIESQVVPNRPLPPVRLTLQNGGRREIQVAVVDFARRDAPKSHRIAPGESVAVDILRESGANQVNRYQGYDRYGIPYEKETITAIPPAVRYEIVVHEWAMQSVAIDRTGKSPNVIEDINMQGKGMGRFTLPPGDQLQAGTMDVYRQAIASKNQGSVAPIIEPEDEGRSDNASKLENAVLEAQRRAMQGIRP